MRYVIDAWAWVEYLIGSEHGFKIKDIIENEKNDIFTCPITIAEVMGMAKREQKDYESMYNLIISLSKVNNITPELSKEVGLVCVEFKKKIKDIGLADVFVLMTAKFLGANVVTGDKHFKNFKNVVFIK